MTALRKETASSTRFQPFGFAGCLYDVDTKLCHLGAREYDPSIGRWLSKDPDLFMAGGFDINSHVKMLQSPMFHTLVNWKKLESNLYGYTFNDPVNFIDSTGRAASQPNIDQGNACSSVFNSTLGSCMSSISGAIAMTAGGGGSTCLAGCGAAGPGAGHCVAAVGTVFAVSSGVTASACAYTAYQAYEKCMGGK